MMNKESVFDIIAQDIRERMLKETELITKWAINNKPIDFSQIKIFKRVKAREIYNETKQQLKGSLK